MLPLGPEQPDRKSPNQGRSPSQRRPCSRNGLAQHQPGEVAEPEAVPEQVAEITVTERAAARFQVGRRNTLIH